MRRALSLAFSNAPSGTSAKSRCSPYLQKSARMVSNPKSTCSDATPGIFRYP